MMQTAEKDAGFTEARNGPLSETRTLPDLLISPGLPG